MGDIIEPVEPTAQIGKTGAFISTIEVLRLRLAPHPVTLRPRANDDDDDDDDDEAELEPDVHPSYAMLQRLHFEHTKVSPKNGKYGDPAVDDLWKAYVDEGKRSNEIDP